MDYATALKQCLGGIPVEEFFSTYWEKKPLYVRGEDRKRFSSLLSLKVVDEILQYSNLKEPHIRVFEKGAAVPEGYFTDSNKLGRDIENGIINSQRVYEKLDDNASIALQFLEKIHGPIFDFCENLEAEIGIRTQANAYITQANSQTLNAHYDMHDVWVLQISGTKHWKIWGDPVKLPMRHPSQKQLFQSSQKRVRGSELILNHSIYPGDSIYIPRGYVHVASTPNDHSMHITIGILAKRLHEVVSNVIDRTIDNMEENILSRMNVGTLLGHKKNKQYFVKQVLNKAKPKLLRESTVSAISEFENDALGRYKGTSESKSYSFGDSK